MSIVLKEKVIVVNFGEGMGREGVLGSGSKVDNGRLVWRK